MACPSIIVSINSALHDVDILVSYFSSHIMYGNEIFKKQRFRLRSLKTFVLLERKLGNDVHLRSEDGSLGSLMTRIEVAVSRNSHNIPPNFHGLENLDDRNRFYSPAKRIASNFQHDFQSLKQEIDEWYITMADYAGQSSSVTVDEVVEIAESIWENLVDFSCFREILAEPMEALLDHMTFLKNFCRFATKRGVQHGQMEDFLTHTGAVALSAAHLCFLCGADIDSEQWLKGMQFNISTMLQKIKPLDPKVCETYTPVLSCSKLSRQFDASTQDMDDDSTIVMTNFIDSLISILWEMLQQNTCHVASLKDRWQLLYEGLRSLRTILKKLPNTVDEQTRDDIGVAVCDAGSLICSFYQKNAQIDPEFQDLLERIKVFMAEIEERVPQTSIFNPSGVTELGFIGFLLENLMELTNGEVEPIVRGHVQSITEELLCLRSFLKEIVELRYERDELRVLWNRVLQVAYRAEFLIDHLTDGDISDSFSMQFDSVMEDIQKIKTDTSRISYGKVREIKDKQVTSTSGYVPSRNPASVTTEVVGFHDEAMSIIDRLIRGSKQLRVIAIVGMAGLGKTTLAAKVFNNPEVMYHFHVRAWCPVSQTFDKKTLLLDLLNQIDPQKKYSEMMENDLATMLRRHLRGRRYLIFLDDIWTIEAWNILEASFPDDSAGSRILLTSRIRDAAPLSLLDTEGPLHLRPLNDEESLELLQMKLFPRDVCPPALYDLGMQIVEICKGLPLTIVIVAGLLAATEQEGWKEIVDGLSSGVVSVTEQSMNILELSYKHLPDYLKPCFLYFGAFPEDQEVSVRKLIRLWIAEGFVQKSKLKSLEDAAEDYMKDLIGRSLIVVAKQRSIGGVKTCRIHDLLHEFCLKKAKEEHFLHLVEGYDELSSFNEPCNLRRLCIHSEPKHFKEAKVFCPRARSLLFFSRKREWYRKEALINILFVIRIFKLVRVLDLEQILLGDEFPSEIGLLVQLRYLAIQGRIRVIPSWVGNLSMLETFIVNQGLERVSLPDTIWNLPKLKFLYIRSTVDTGGGVLPIENLDSSCGLYELDTFCGAVFDHRGSMEKQMRKFQNIRKLKCMLFWRWDHTEGFQNIGVPDFLSRLESLQMIGRWPPPEDIQIEFCFPANLKKLTLSGFWLPWSKISTIGKLPHLEVLKLLGDSFIGETWKMEEGEFPKLRYLKLTAFYLVRWTASDDYEFPDLEKLVLEKCWYLEKMPSCLEYTPPLQLIEVWNCSEATTSLVKNIQEEQLNMGNSDFQIIIQSSDDPEWQQ